MPGESTEMVLQTRSRIRKEKLHAREALENAFRDEASALIADTALSLIRDIRTIHAYLSFRSEVATASLIEKCFKRSIRVIVPWVEDDGELSHHELLALDRLAEGPYGLPHPARNEFSALEEIGIVFLPLAAFDRQGNRLGYGKGFYDRFLVKLPSTILRVGLAFAIQESEQIPAMPHDQKLDIIITERETIRI